MISLIAKLYAQVMSGSAPGTAELSLEIIGSLMRELVEEFPFGASGAQNRPTALALAHTQLTVQRNQYSGISTESTIVHTTIVKEPRGCMTLHNCSRILLDVRSTHSRTN